MNRRERSDLASSVATLEILIGPNVSKYSDARPTPCSRLGRNVWRISSSSGRAYVILGDDVRPYADFFAPEATLQLTESGRYWGQKLSSE